MAKKNGAADPQSTINLRVLSALSLFASKDETRYYLNGVCVEIEERSVTYVGTDGHRMLAYREDAAPDEPNHGLTGTFIIPTSHCKHFKLDKEEEGRAILSQAAVNRLTIAHGFMDVTFLPIDGVYPHWRKALPQTLASGVPAQFNLKYLADFGKVAKLLEIGQPFIGHNGEAPAFIWFSGHPNVMGIAMPVKAVDEMSREAPQWARKGPARDQGDLEDAELFAMGEGFDPETGEITPKPEAAAEAANAVH